MLHFLRFRDMTEHYFEPIHEKTAPAGAAAGCFLNRCDVSKAIIIIVVGSANMDLVLPVDRRQWMFSMAHSLLH
jgi:hypothetical protein